MKKVVELLKNKKIVFIALAIIVIASFSCIFTVQIVRNIERKKMEQQPLLTYEAIRSEDEDEDQQEYNIIIKITSADGLEKITYKKKNSEDEMTLNCKGKNVVGIDYTVTVGENYDFKIKQVGKDEVTETICYEVPYIEGNYALVNGVYSNTPDLTGYDQRYTRYLTANGDNLDVGNWISAEVPTDWYSYKESKWANIYVENNGEDVYYTWIPRYAYKVDTASSTTGNERTDVKFVDMNNNYKDESGNEITWQELKAQGYQIPAAFRWNGTKIPGYWAMKYTAGDIISPSIIYYSMVAYRGKISVSGITLNTNITKTNPITKYTFSINGEIMQTIEDATEVANIASKTIEFTNVKEGENVINVTGLNAAGEIVGSMTKVYEPAKVNEPDLSGFDKNTTFYVTYDENQDETSTIPISNDAPEDWYEYGEARWANIVVRNNGLETYYTWIPRYEFIADSVNQRTTVHFIEGTRNTPTDTYQIPEAFTFNGVELTGYWAMKYTAGDESAPLFSTELTSTSSSIKTKGITGTKVADGQKYRYYINGEYKYETTDKNENYEYTGLNSGELYTILVEIRNSTTNAYIGTAVKQIKTGEPNKPELLGFNTNNTYYVTYDDAGNEIIGDKVTSDGANAPSNWYDYSASKWANIVVTDGTVIDGAITGATVTTYYTWIPRYEYRIISSEQAKKETGRTEVRFISGTSTDVDTGWQIPEAFKFNEKELTGYWAMKYTAGG